MTMMAMTRHTPGAIFWVRRKLVAVFMCSSFVLALRVDVGGLSLSVGWLGGRDFDDDGADFDHV